MEQNQKKYLIDGYIAYYGELLEDKGYIPKGDNYEKIRQSCYQALRSSFSQCLDETIKYNENASIECRFATKLEETGQVFDVTVHFQFDPLKFSVGLEVVTICMQEDKDDKIESRPKLSSEIAEFNTAANLLLRVRSREREENKHNHNRKKGPAF